MKSDNISVSVKEANGKITHTLNNELKEIGSSGGKDDKGAKITLAKDKKEISPDESKLKELLDGDIDKDSKKLLQVNNSQI